MAATTKSFPTGKNTALPARNHRTTSAHYEKEHLMSNPLSYNGELADYTAVKAEHIKPAFKTIIATATKELQALEAGVTPTWEYWQFSKR